MTLKFLGTRGNISIRSAAHRMHSSLMVSCRRGRVVIDCGADWLERARHQQAAGIFITHAHPDHIGGLRAGSPCPVYATTETWNTIAGWPLVDRRVLSLRHAISVAGLHVEAWPIEHAINAPAVGYRVSDGGVRIFYAPDIARLADPLRALHAVDLYVGDGAAVERPLLRRRGAEVIGHATIGTQLAWCEAAGVRRAIFTHCGTRIVASDAGRMQPKIRALGRVHGCAARVAHDGLAIRVRSAPSKMNV